MEGIPADVGPRRRKLSTLYIVVEISRSAIRSLRQRSSHLRQKMLVCDLQWFQIEPIKMTAGLAPVAGDFELLTYLKSRRTLVSINLALSHYIQGQFDPV